MTQLVLPVKALTNDSRLASPYRGVGERWAIDGTARADQGTRVFCVAHSRRLSREERRQLVPVGLKVKYAHLPQEWKTLALEGSAPAGL